VPCSNDNDLQVLEVLESEGNKEDENDKFNRVDVIVKDSKVRHILIGNTKSKRKRYCIGIL